MSSHNAPISIETTRSRLHQISKAEPNTLRSFVAEEAFHGFAYDPRQMFEDLAHHGCQSGMIGSLTYYVDTHRFFDTFYEEIEEMRHSMQAESGMPLTFHGDLKNTLAWCAFEQAALDMARTDLALSF